MSSLLESMAAFTLDQLPDHPRIIPPVNIAEKRPFAANFKIPLFFLRTALEAY